MYLKSAFAAAALAGSSVVFAQDASVFSGPRFEIRAGLDVIGSKYEETYSIDSVNNPALDFTDSDSERAAATGVAYGLGAGYDIAIGSFVLGIEANIDLSSTKKNVDLGFFDLDDGYVKAGRDIELSVRSGVQITNNTLFYVKAGYVNGRGKIGGEDEDGERVSRARNLDGWRIGAGVETALTSGAYLKLEYNYTNYENLGDSVTRAHPLGTETAAYGFGFDRHKTVAALGYRF